MRRKATAAAAVGIVLCLPAAAHAATQNVFVGTPPSAQKSFQKSGVDANQFFPKSVSIHVGDKVTFTPVGFHNVDLPPKGGHGVPFASPTGKKISGEADAAGTAFWFNGQDALAFNPVLTMSGYGKAFTAPSVNRITSGLPFAAKPKPMVVTFKKAGVYSYVCDLHPGMAGTVKVLAAKAKVPNAAGVAKLVAAQIKSDAAVVPGLAKVPVAANTVSLGTEKSGVHRYAFLPESLKVSPGTTVTFKMPAISAEAHTATFGPGDPGNEKAKSYLGDLAAGINAPVFLGQSVYPSETPGTIASLSPTLHGNGFWNSGILDAAAASPLPSSAQLKFDTPGTYTYYCLIHPFMKGEVVVG